MDGFGYSFAFPFGEERTSTGAVDTATLGGLLDQEIDPVTLDFIDTEDGAWSETADSRAIVLCQLELELAQSYHTPSDGTDLKDRLREGDPITTADIVAETRRAMRVLEQLGIIGQVEILGTDENGEQLVDEAGRAVLMLSWTDLATGSPVEDVYRPMGG